MSTAKAQLSRAGATAREWGAAGSALTLHFPLPALVRVRRRRTTLNPMPNALASQTSPYLRQHAENPVDWLPWGPEALAAARERDVPLLVSIGYSSCHWCHVMEHESFEDPSVAALMNEEFVCVKVDREERPDVDALYMEAVQGMTGHGGWPLNVFLTPEQTPFYGGTYFPPEPRHGMPSWTQVLQAIAETWRENAAEIRAGGERIREQLSRAARMEPSAEPFDTGALDTAVATLRALLRRDPRRASAARRSSRRHRSWSSCCATASARCRSRRCARWRAGASTTSSAAAFTATRSTPRGRCRTSRRCSTTTRCWRAPICTRTDSWMGMEGRGARWRSQGRAAHATCATRSRRATHVATRS